MHSLTAAQSGVDLTCGFNEEGEHSCPLSRSPKKSGLRACGARRRGNMLQKRLIPRASWGPLAEAWAKNLPKAWEGVSPDGGRT
jgi:hypothetical protein